MAKTENGYVEINKFIDTKPMFGNWEVDTLAIFSIFIAIAIMFARGAIAFGIFFVLGVVTAKYYEKLKKSRVKGFFFHIIYMLGLRQPKTLPPSYMRYFLGA
ncbi:type IV conjugative transfer system protein TraL [Campylobacter jejuni]|uniref:type IV conjugative transfer system protein TraL n=1 Tax=Campylobacter TaxID=194 RepID=UPI00069C16F3|nr:MULTISPECIES: type IV conjugative transfer system protein TraL [Campylobacter]AXL29205.1 pilus assembly protein [Campylobacter jejuni]EAH5338716.1 type IV conjugative transfer system protein TraL [Campylobacter jejuni]EAH5435127.1 type IV conjugative transfer system protein TraL [Campylobacter jejuni]EAH7099326.1 type IV conjugative transfer system protein TraL [Campylobacter jejuni]EAH9078097.1 type IV conjugative transfer system protein TraL [Campylobacter jejuni]